MLKITQNAFIYQLSLGVKIQKTKKKTFHFQGLPIYKSPLSSRRKFRHNNQIYYMNLVVGKPVFLASDKVMLKPASATKTG